MARLALTSHLALTRPLALSEAEGVPVGVVEPRAASRTELRDVASRREWPFCVVDERNTFGLEVADRGLDVGHLEVGKGVFGGNRRALEDRELAAVPAAKADGDRVLPEEVQPKRLAIERLRPLNIGDRHRGHNHRCSDHE